MHALFNALITSKMRIRILVRLFLNPGQHAYLRGLAEEFGASTSQVREELRNLSEAGLLDCKKDGRQMNYRANPAHPLFPELQSMVRKSLGMDRIIESILARLGDLETAILIDDYAAGKDTGLIDLVLVGQIDRSNLADLVGKTERYIKRKIRTLVMTETEYKKMQNIFQDRPMLVLWTAVKDKRKTI